MVHQAKGIHKAQRMETPKSHRQLRTKSKRQSIPPRIHPWRTSSTRYGMKTWGRERMRILPVTVKTLLTCPPLIHPAVCPKQSDKKVFKRQNNRTKVMRARIR